MNNLHVQCGKSNSHRRLHGYVHLFMSPPSMHIEILGAASYIELCGFHIQINRPDVIIFWSRARFRCLATLA